MIMLARNALTCQRWSYLYTITGVCRVSQWQTERHFAWSAELFICFHMQCAPWIRGCSATKRHCHRLPPRYGTMQQAQTVPVQRAAHENISADGAVQTMPTGTYHFGRDYAFTRFLDSSSRRGA